MQGKVADLYVALSSARPTCTRRARFDAAGQSSRCGRRHPVGVGKRRAGVSRSHPGARGADIRRSGRWNAFSVTRNSTTSGRHQRDSPLPHRQELVANDDGDGECSNKCRIGRELRRRSPRCACGPEAVRARHTLAASCCARARRPALGSRFSVSRDRSVGCVRAVRGPSAGRGIIAGIGRCRREVMIVANDSTVKAAPISLTSKALAAQTIARENALRASI